MKTMTKMGLNLNPNIKHENKKQEHKVCKTKFQTNLFLYLKTWTWNETNKVWCKITPWIGVQIMDENIDFMKMDEIHPWKLY
jgi:hypothetical protein